MKTVPNKMEPPIKAFNCINFDTSTRLTIILQILLSSPQIIVDAITNTLPIFNLNMELLKSRFVVTRNTPPRINVTAIYPTRLNLSLKISSANKIENTVSPFASSAVSPAVLSFNPTKKIIGAMVAPATALVRIRP